MDVTKVPKFKSRDLFTPNKVLKEGFNGLTECEAKEKLELVLKVEKPMV